MRGPCAWAGLTLLGLALATARPAAAEPVLSLGAASLSGAALEVEVSLSGFVDEDLRKSLEAGLPAALLLRWRLWEQRDGWWDRELASGLLRQRIFYDVLEARYALFDARGRRVALCADARALAAELATPRRLSLSLPGALPAGLAVELEIEARLEPLTSEELRELEQWLAGGEAKGQPGLLGGFRGGSERFLRRMAGLGSRQAKARCAVNAAP
jgi:hypothetical protein